MRDIWTKIIGSAVAAAVLGLALCAGGSGSSTVQAATTEVAAAGQNDGNSTYMTLKINGTIVEGDTTRASRKGMIEVLSFEQAVTTAREAGSGMATGRRQYQPLLIRKRIDKASPLLMKALTENSSVEVQFGFYRPNPMGDGTEERFYEIGIRQARVSSIKIVQDGSGAPMEEISFVFQSISWTYTNGGITHEDSWSQQR